MILELKDYETKTYNGSIIYVLKNKEASFYGECNIFGDCIVGAFWDNSFEVIGINTLMENDIYSPEKLREIMQRETNSENTTLQPINENEIIGWWNTIICDDQKDQDQTQYDDIELTKEDLKNYFVETVEVRDDEWGKTTWYNYYINPCVCAGITVRLGNDSKVCFDFMDIEKMVLVESDSSVYPKTIYFYDKKQRWIEDNDISTRLPWEDIKFVFAEDDLENASTTNYEKQLFIELHEKLNPWDGLEECNNVLEDFLIKRHKYTKGQLGD